MNRTALEKMIDEACGIPDDYVDNSVTLACRICKKKKYARRVDSDPEGTKAVVMTCPDCGGSTLPLEYFAEDGTKITTIG